MSRRLEGKISIVTGGASGIGRATCQVFAAEGASVAVVDSNGQGAKETLDTLETTHGQQHCFIEADVTKANDVKRIFETAAEKAGRKCNVLVNCAGIFRSQKCFTEAKEEDFDEIMNVNLKGTYLMSREFASSLKDVDAEVRGSLINLSSLVARSGSPQVVEYVASKCGVIGLTKSIALEFPKLKVRSNAILPGPIDTPMVQKVRYRFGDAFVETIPMRRLGRPDEIAKVCLFLASDDSSYINGSSLEVTGGL